MSLNGIYITVTQMLESTNEIVITVRYTIEETIFERMNIMIKRIGSIILVLIVSIVFIAPIEATPSDWAEEHVKIILLAGMSNPELLKSEDLQNPITREEFAELLVYLYAEAKDVSIDSIPQWNPFMDTKNPMVARAYNLGIVSGTSILDDGRRKFSPDALVTREQMAVMLVNELELLGITTTPKYTKSFSDADKISAWAYEHLAFATEEDIILGVGSNLVAPRESATREQALTLAHKIVLKYNWIDSEALKSRYNSSNAISTHGFYRPNISVSQLQSYLQGNELTFRMSYMVDSYNVDIKKQGEDLIHILSVSNTLKYNAFVVLKNEIENCYDNIGKTFNNKSTIYINSITGETQDTPFSSSYFELKIDDALLLTYRP